ncbi:MAG TPA: hypothetical protein PKA83_15360 [Pirellulaceae bacterium]|nr:hypothetical protein [Pirellulaceae bacterium]
MGELLRGDVSIASSPPTDLSSAVEQWKATGKAEPLYISDKIITDFFPLLEIEGLTKLTVEGEKFEDYSTLCKLDELQSLFIHDLGKDIHWISDLQQISELEFTDCEFRDLAPIAKLKNLKRLGFYWCVRFSDLTPLSQLKQLEHLMFYECSKVVDLQPLSYCRNLTTIELIDCFKLRDLTPLASLQKLKMLRLVGGNDKINVSPLLKLKSLDIRYRE